MSFGIDNPHEGAHVPGPTCPACVAGYPKPCTPAPAVERVTAGKITAAEQTRLAMQCGGFLHGELIEGQTQQRCDACGMPAPALGGDLQVLTAADIGVVKPADLGVR